MKDSDLIPSDSSVQATSDDATVSKFSSAMFNYFDDQYLKFFVKHPVKRSPLINRGYYARVASLRKIMRRFFELYPSGQLVNFGSGLDTTFFWLSDIFPNVTHFEIDFPEVVAKKSRIILRCAELRAKATGVENSANNPDTIVSHHGECIETERLRMIPVDMRDIEMLKATLEKRGFSPSVPTLFLAECCFVYLEPRESDKLIEFAASAVPGAPSCLVAYEQIKPDDAFGRTMVKNLEMRGCPLLGIHKYPSLESQTQRYQSLGWSGSSGLDMNDVYDTYVDKDDVQRVQRLEIFDEIEEWRLIQAHYFVAVVASSNWKQQPSAVAQYFLSLNDAHGDEEVD